MKILTRERYNISTILSKILWKISRLFFFNVNESLSF